MLSMEGADVFVEVAVAGSVDIVDTLVGSRENVGSGLLPGTGVDVVPVPGILPHALTSININKIKYGNRFSVIPPWFKVFFRKSFLSSTWSAQENPFLSYYFSGQIQSPNVINPLHHTRWREPAHERASALPQTVTRKSAYHFVSSPEIN